MGSKIFVGGLPYATSESQLEGLFSPHGTVQSVQIVTDRFTGQSRGFGFVEMGSAEEASQAITALNGTQLDGRTLKVDEAKPSPDRGSRGGGGFGGGGGGFGGGGKRGRW